jgi:16S rRNA (uracil1498-N3)-methyltransferase
VHRFFAPSLDAGDETVALPRDEAEHLTRVLRIAAGDEVAVFDGRGHEYLARVIGAVRRDVRLQVLSRIEPANELPVAVTLVQAILKGDKMDDVVRDAVMLGVAAIQPVVTRRTEMTIAALLRGARPDRWRRVALASVKQSRRAVLPEIRTPLTFETYLDEPPATMRLMLVEPRVDVDTESLGVLRGVPAPHDASVIVGPEGGWDEREWAAAQTRGVQLISLGHRTLRADAVPIAALSVLNFLWDSEL